MSRWECRNFAWLSREPAHVEADASGFIRKNGWGKAIMIRWTSDFDCGYETPWWYCIKDDEFDLSAIPAKKRYIINKGIKTTEINKIDPAEYAEELFRIYKVCQESYAHGQPVSLNQEGIINRFRNANTEVEQFLGCFDRESGALVGYAICVENANVLELQSVKVDPAYLKNEVNAALVYFVCMTYLPRVQYISDGARNIYHETAYQDYLIKYFGFRRAYCILHVKYRPPFGLPIGIISRLGGRILSRSENSLLKKLYALCRQDAFARECKKIQKTQEK